MPGHYGKKKKMKMMKAGGPAKSGQALFDALKKKGFKAMGGTMTSKKKGSMSYMRAGGPVEQLD